MLTETILPSALAQGYEWGIYSVRMYIRTVCAKKCFQNQYRLISTDCDEMNSTSWYLMTVLFDIWYILRVTFVNFNLCRTLQASCVQCHTIIPTNRYDLPSTTSPITSSHTVNLMLSVLSASIASCFLLPLETSSQHTTSSLSPPPWLANNVPFCSRCVCQSQRPSGPSC